MDQIKQLSNEHSNKLPYLFLSGALIAAFNTFCRPDYNFIVYLYMYFVWEFMGNNKEIQAKQKLSSFYILIYSLLIDLIYTIYWGSKWGSLEKDYEGTLHSFVIFLSWIGIILKIVISIMIGVLDWENIKSSLPEKLQEKVNNGNFQPFNEENNNV